MFGEKIRRFRMENGYTQREFAALCGIHQSNICLYETEKAIPQKKTFEKIAAVMGISVSELLADEYGTNVWVNANERQPEENRVYLVITGIAQDGVICQNGPRVMMHNGTRWKTDGQAVVLYWMEIPPVPEKLI